MTRATLWTFLVLLVLVAASGAGVVYAKYLSRTHFVELQGLRSERDALAVEWGRLRIEEAALTTHTRVERFARRDLGMHMPASVDVRVVIGGRQ